MEILITEETAVAGFGGVKNHRVHTVGFRNAAAMLSVSVERVQVNVHMNAQELRAIGNAALKVADAIDQHETELV